VFPFPSVFRQGMASAMPKYWCKTNYRAAAGSSAALARRFHRLALHSVDTRIELLDLGVPLGNIRLDDWF
jgi:hypothetical protein